MQIQQDVIEGLRWDQSLSSSEIGVEVGGGVTLAGHIASHSEKWNAETAVQRVSGVKALAEIDVILSGSSQRLDADIARFAKDAGAVITALHVVPRYSRAYEGEGLQEFRRECVSAAEEFLEEINAEARNAGVPCNPLHVTSDYPYDAILRAAEEQHCDLIAMASHGQKGVKGMLLGSETQKVSTHAKLPVLVFR